jgi:hypothetical protein
MYCNVFTIIIIIIITCIIIIKFMLSIYIICLIQTMFLGYIVLQVHSVYNFGYM